MRRSARWTNRSVATHAKKQDDKKGKKTKTEATVPEVAHRHDNPVASFSVHVLTSQLYMLQCTN